MHGTTIKISFKTVLTILKLRIDSYDYFISYSLKAKTFAGGEYIDQLSIKLSRRPLLREEVFCIPLLIYVHILYTSLNNITS